MSYPLFSELPFEIQLTIWDQAAVEYGPLSFTSLRPLYQVIRIPRVKSWFYRRRPHNVYEFKELYVCLYSWSGHHREFPVVSKSLMRACRLLRLAALERWKSNIETIAVLDQMHNAKRLVPVLKGELVRSLEEDIDALHA